MLHALHAPLARLSAALWLAGCAPANIAGSDRGAPSDDSGLGTADGGDGGAGGDGGPVDTGPVEQIGDDCPEGVYPRIVVNELVAANINGLLDEDEDSPDWFELANLDTQAVSLAGWGVSDGAGDVLEWLLPDVDLGPGEVLLVFASGKDRTTGELHSNFSLGVDEPVRLSPPEGCVLDKSATAQQVRDVSWGRPFDAPDTWGFFMEPTPGAPNTTESRPGFADTPVLAPPAGWVEAGTEITVSAAAGAQITLTDDGSVPNEDSFAYAGPIVLETEGAGKLMRAVAFQDGVWPSRPATAWYSSQEAILQDGLKVVSLTVDPFDLWDEETGIYAYGPPDYSPNYPYFGANFWEDWERDLHIQVFEPDGSLVLDQDAGVKIHGGYTRAFNQKNFRVIARAGYGEDLLSYGFFPHESQSEYKIMVLEGVGDWCPTHTENALVSELFRAPDGQRDATIDTQAWEPAVVYLNGEFWGLYAFREKLDEHFIAAHHGADPDNLDRIECTADGTDDWWRVSQGDWAEFDALEEFVATHDLAEDAAWAQFKTMVDIENLATAVIAEGYWGNTDWWNNNLKLWREREDGAKWRWMVFDLGHGWGYASYDHVGTSVAWNGPGLPIAAALRNPEFRILLANQASDFLNTRLASDRALDTLDTMHERIRPVIAEQYALWCYQPQAYWDSRVAYARGFVRDRPDFLWGHFQTHLGLGAPTAMTLQAEPAGSGHFGLTVVEVEAPFTGSFWTGIPVKITALPAEGYSFVGWDDASLGTDPEISLVLDGPKTLTARFE